MYTDRLRELKYTSPSGKKFTLLFDGLSRTGGKKAPVSEFPGQNQGAVQDLGELTGTFPITCYIAGLDYDTEADRFWNALAESGAGKLDHPRWGTINVLPSTREQSEQFVDGAGRAVFTITFIRTDDTVFDYPKSFIVPDDQITADADAAADGITATLEGKAITDVREKAGLKENVLSTLDTVTGIIGTVTAFSDDLRETIDGTVNEIIREIDILIASPQLLMESLLKLYRLPARVVTDVTEKVKAYKTIYISLANGFAETTKEYGEMFGIIASAQLQGVAIATAESTLNGNIPTRTQAGEIVDGLTGLYSDIIVTIEAIETAGNFTVDYETTRLTLQTVSRSVENLIDRALSLPTERILKLEKDVTPLQFAWELYGDLDRLDELIEYNNLLSDNILLIPRNTEVRWYA